MKKARPENKANIEAIRFKYSVVYTLAFVTLLWFVKAVEWAMSLDFGMFGIHPRTLQGTFGIITGPLIHGDLMHLLSNTFPLVLLGIGIFYFYNKIALEVFVWIYFMTGFWVWIAARDAYHIGASGIVYGLVAFLFFSGLFRKDTRSIAVALVVIFLYGGMIYGIVPADNGISWESHLLGSLAGIFCAFYFRKAGKNIDMGVLSYDEEEDEEVTLLTGPEEGTWSTSTHSTAEDPTHFRYTFVSKAVDKVSKKESISGKHTITLTKS